MTADPHRPLRAETGTDTGAVGLDAEPFGELGGQLLDRGAVDIRRDGTERDG